MLRGMLSVLLAVVSAHGACPDAGLTVVVGNGRYVGLSNARQLLDPATSAAACSVNAAVPDGTRCAFTSPSYGTATARCQNGAWVPQLLTLMSQPPSFAVNPAYIATGTTLTVTAGQRLPYIFPSFLTGVFAQTGNVIPTCPEVTNRGLFRRSAQPGMHWDTSGNVELSFELNSNSFGSTEITCYLEAAGPVASVLEFTISVVGSVAGAPCTGGICTIARDYPDGFVTAAPGQAFSAPFITNLQAGTDPVCHTPSDIFAVPPSVDGSGRLTFTTGGVQATSTIACTVSNGLATSVFSFEILILDAGMTLWLRIRSTRGATGTLMSALGDLTVAGQPNLMYACPVASCTLQNCGQTLEERARQGCTPGAEVTLWDQDTWLDVDFSQPDPTARARMRKIIDEDVQSCPACRLNTVNPTGSPSLVPAVSNMRDGDGGNDDDDDGDVPWWVWLILAGVLLLLLLLIVCCCFQRSRSKAARADKQTNNEAGPREESEYTREMQSNPEDGSYYNSEGSKKPYDDYTQTQTSYTVGEEFPAGTAVSALYLDGQYYPGTIWSRAPDGTYSVRWEDGTHSEGIPAGQMIRK